MLLSGWFPMRQCQLLHQFFSLNDHLLMANGKVTLHIDASYTLLIFSTNSSGVSISIFEKPNHLLPKSFMDAPM